MLHSTRLTLPRAVGDVRMVGGVCCQVSKVHSADYVQFLDLLSREVAAKGGQPVPFKPFVPKAQLTPSQPSETTQPDTTEVSRQTRELSHTHIIQPCRPAQP